MPGIFGLATLSLRQEVGERLLAMAASLRHHSWYHQDLSSGILEGAGVGLGRMRLDFGDLTPQPAINAQGSLQVVLDGEIYDAKALRKQLLAAGCPCQNSGAAELLVHGYEFQGERFFQRLHGKFAAAIWDQRLQCLHLVNDRFGMRAVYYTRLPGCFLFASEIKALLVHAEVNRKADLRGIAQFFTFGQLFGEDTFLESVRLLPAAGWLTYDAREDRLDVKQYWQLAAEPQASASPAQHLERIDDAFGNAVRRCTTGPERLGLSLSGGLDSRTILGAIDDAIPVKTVCVGMPGGADHQSAAEMARLTSRPHHGCLLGDGFLENYEEHLRQMVRLTDGHYLSQCIVMPTLPVYRDLGIQVLLRGHAGELLHMRKAYSFSLDDRALALADEAALEAWVFGRLQAYLLEGTDGKLFAPAIRSHIEGLAHDSLRASLRESEGIQPLPHRIWHLFVRQRLRRETALSLVKFGSLMETRLPYLDNDLVDALFAAPPDLKLDQTIQAYILKKRRPAFLKVLNVNTGAAMDAGSFQRLIAKVRHKVFAKLGVPGYQPYERLGLWLRRELRPLVQKVLLSEQCLDRGVFDPATIKKAVDDHMRGTNNTYLLLALMVFEMGQREVLEGTKKTAVLAAADEPPGMSRRDKPAGTSVNMA